MIILIFQLVFLSILVPRETVYSSTTAKVKVNLLNVRKGPGLDYPVITQVKKGETYSILEEKNGWSKIKVGQSNGWVADWLVEKMQIPSNKTQQTARSTVKNLNVRSGPSTTFPVIDKVQDDKNYLIVDQEGDWLKIQLKPNKVGWIAKWLTKTSTSTPPTEDTTKKEKVKIKATKLNVRSGPSTQHTIIGYFVNDDETEVYEVKNGWYRIQWNNQEGWIASQYATQISGGDKQKDDQEPAEIVNQPKVVILHPGTNLRQLPTTRSSILSIANQGDQFPIIGTEGDWYAITLSNGQKAYVAGWIVSVTGVEDKIEHGVEKALVGRTIVVDPGHGGYDSGSIGTFFKTKEKDVNLAVAKRLQKKLEAAGAKVIMTRESDLKVSLPQRAYIANTNQVDAFLSIHHNTIANPSVSGTITYYYKNQEKELAKTVHSELLKKNGKKDLNTRFGNFHVLRENQKRSILVEISFLTNYQDELHARSSTFQEKSAEGIFEGVVKYLRKGDGN